jgi:hypothetical protein
MKIQYRNQYSNNNESKQQKHSKSKQTEQNSPKNQQICYYYVILQFTVLSIVCSFRSLIGSLIYRITK